MKSEEANVKVKVGRMPTFKIYQVTREELQKIREGSDGAIYFNVAIALLAIAVSATLSFYNIETNAPTAARLAWHYAAMGAGYLFGFAFLAISQVKKSNLRKLMDEIEARMDEEDERALKKEMEEISVMELHELANRNKS